FPFVVTVKGGAKPASVSKTYRLLYQSRYGAAGIVISNVLLGLSGNTLDHDTNQHNAVSIGANLSLLNRQDIVNLGSTVTVIQVVEDFANSSHNLVIDVGVVVHTIPSVQGNITAIFIDLIGSHIVPRIENVVLIQLLLKAIHDLHNKLQIRNPGTQCIAAVHRTLNRLQDSNFFVIVNAIGSGIDSI